MVTTDKRDGRFLEHCSTVLQRRERSRQVRVQHVLNKSRLKRPVGARLENKARRRSDLKVIREKTTKTSVKHALPVPCSCASSLEWTVNERRAPNRTVPCDLEQIERKKEKVNPCSSFASCFFDRLFQVASYASQLKSPFSVAKLNCILQTKQFKRIFSI
jgi:hypothetical protein